MEEKQKIGGWLLLLGAQLILSFLIYTYSLRQYIGFFNTTTWTKLSIMQDSFLWKTFFICQSVLFILLIISGLFVLLQFAYRKRKFRNYYIIFMIISIIGFLGLYLIASKIDTYPIESISGYKTAIFGHIIWFVIWVNYLFKASRPKLTFIN
jgi:hypothetical protein